MSLYNHRLTYRPLRGGLEIYNAVVDEVGTLGFIAQSPRGGPERWLVSCYHVLVGSPNTLPGEGETILQPSAVADAVAVIDPMHMDAGLDCAAAKVLYGITATAEILGIGCPGVPIDPVPGMRLLKSGATTGVTEGVVETVAGDDVTIAIPDGFDPNYELSGPGDSGSLWLARDTLQPVALHIRGMTGATRRCSAKRIVAVLAALDLVLVNG